MTALHFKHRNMEIGWKFGLYKHGGQVSVSACGKGIQTLLGYLGCLKYKATHHFLHSCPEQAVDKLTQELLMDGNTISQPLPVSRVYSASKHTKLELKKKVIKT